VKPCFTVPDIEGDLELTLLLSGMLIKVETISLFVVII